MCNNRDRCAPLLTTCVVPGTEVTFRIYVLLIGKELTSDWKTLSLMSDWFGSLKILFYSDEQREWFDVS